MVKLENPYSEVSRTLCSVPQGSIFGLLLFLLYANDVSRVVKCNLFLYVDDICLVFQSENVKDTYRKAVK